MRVLTYNTGISGTGYLVYDAHTHLRRLSFSSWYDDSNQVTSDNPILGPSLGRIESAGEDSQIFWDAIVSLNWDHHLSCSNRIYLLVI